MGNASRAAIIIDRKITGLSADVIAGLVAEVGPLWHARHQAKLTSRLRKRAVGAGAKHRLVFVDVRRPTAGRKDRDKFISGKSKQNAVKTMVVTDGDGRVLFCSPAQHGSCADITHARQLGLVRLLADGPAVEILADTHRPVARLAEGGVAARSYRACPSRDRTKLRDRTFDLDSVASPD